MGWAGGWEGLAACAHRWCPYCGQILLAESAELTGRALEVLSAEGWDVALGVFTFPHRLDTPASALASACKAGLQAISDNLKAWRTPAAQAAYSELLRGERAGSLSPETRAELLDRIRRGSIQWTARVELTCGENGLHPHVNALFLIPPSGTRPEGIYAGRIFEQLEDPTAEKESGATSNVAPPSAETCELLDRLFPPIFEALHQPQQKIKPKKVKRYVHLTSLERDIHDVWTNATLDALRAGDPVGAWRYRAVDAGLDDKVAKRAERVAELGDDHPHYTQALGDLDNARRAAASDSPERQSLRWRACSVLEWEGSPKAAAAYAFGQGGHSTNTWGAAQEASGAGKSNTLWRALDCDQTAPLWGAWCLATERARLTRGSRGVQGWLEELAAQAPQAEEIRRRREVVGEAHPLVRQWAEDQQRERELLDAAALGPSALDFWLASNLPPILRPLVYLREPGLELEGPDDDPQTLASIRLQLLASAAGLRSGYWIGPDGRPLTWIDAEGVERSGRPPPALALRRSIRAAALYGKFHREIPGTIAEMGDLARGVPLSAFYSEASERAERLAEMEVIE